MIPLETKDSWLLEKWGMFSGSEIYKLFSKGVGTNLFGKGALTYINKVARQAYTSFNDRDSIETYDMKMGKVNESQAFGHLYKLLGFNGLEYHGDSNPVLKKYECKRKL